MLFKTILIIFPLLVLDNSLMVNTSTYNFIINNVSCLPIANGVKNFECIVTKLAPNNYAFTANIIFSKSMNKNFIIRYLIDIIPISMNKSIRLIDVKLSACDVIRTRINIPLVDKLLTEIRRTVNLPRQCPFKANFSYYCKNFTLNDQFWNKFMPYVHFAQSVDLYDSNMIIASAAINGSLLPRTISKRNL